MSKKTRRIKPYEKDRTDKAAPCERETRIEIERLSNDTLILIRKGECVENGYDPNIDLKGKIDSLDYLVTFNGKEIAWIEVSCCNFTFEGSRIMPVSSYKGAFIQKSDLLCFIVFSMEKEQLPKKDRCVWIRGRDVIKSEHKWDYIGGKNQPNYYTNKEDWIRGLESLVSELIRLTD
jgi:hypothetical protein